MDMIGIAIRRIINPCLLVILKAYVTWCHGYFPEKRNILKPGQYQYNSSSNGFLHNPEKAG